MGKLIRLDNPIEIEFTLDKKVYKSPNSNFMILRIFSDTMAIKPYLNPVYNNVSMKVNTVGDIKYNVKYKAKIMELEYDKKWGYSIKGQEIIPSDFSADSINDDDTMLNFIELFIGESVADKLKNVIGICDIIKNKNTEELLKIHGIGEKTVNKIYNSYQENVENAHYLMTLKQLGFTDNAINKLNTVYNKNLYEACQQIKSNIFDLVFKGFRLDIIDNIFLSKMEGNKRDERRLECYTYKAINDVLYEDFESFISISRFMRLPVIENTIDNVGDKIFNKCIDKLIKDRKIYIIEDKYITTYGIYNCDVNLYRNLRRLINGDNKSNVNIDIDKEINYEEERLGVKLNKGQRNCVKSVLTHNISLLTGGGGVGKTFTLNIILNIMDRLYEPFLPTLVALSGKASGVLAESTNREASTIHRALGFSGGFFMYDKTNPLKTDMLVIDEVSMVSNELMVDLLSAIETGTKILFIGDEKQLTSIGHSNTINDLNKLPINKCQLTEPMRQAMKSGILNVCTDIRNDKNPFVNKKFALYGELKDMSVTIGDDKYWEMINDYVENFDVNNKLDYVVLACTKKETSRINIDIQNELIKKGKLNKDSNYIEISTDIKEDDKRVKMKIYPGSVLLITKNKYNVLSEEDYYNNRKDGNKSLFNGNTVIVEEIYSDAIKVSFNNENFIILSAFYDILSGGYSYSIHRSQGSTIKYLYIYLSNTYVVKEMLLVNEALYTAVSRGKIRCKLYVEKYIVLTKAINNREINKRQTILELLIDGKIALK